MSPREFVERYRKALPVPPPELDIHLETFVGWKRADLEAAGLSSEDAHWLSEAGLPKDAAPFLSFRNVPADEQNVPAGYFEIGFTNYGDLICLELETRCVVFFNHDRNDERVLINSSIPLLCESLCIYREYLNVGKGDHSFTRIAEVDSVLTRESFWGTEVIV